MAKINNEIKAQRMDNFFFSVVPEYKSMEFERIEVFEFLFIAMINNFRSNK